MSGELKTQGTKLYRGTGTGSPETFVEVINITDFNGPSPSRPEIDKTNLSSTAKEYLLGLKDFGTMTFNGNMAPGNTIHQTILETDLDADTPRNWKVEFEDGSTAVFAAFVQGFPLQGGVDDIVKYSLTLRITGEITWDWAA